MVSDEIEVCPDVPSGRESADQSNDEGDATRPSIRRGYLSPDSSSQTETDCSRATRQRGLPPGLLSTGPGGERDCLHRCAVGPAGAHYSLPVQRMASTSPNGGGGRRSPRAEAPYGAFGNSLRHFSAPAGASV